jgi:DNA-binding CsgD family transcriptional regulator
MTDYWGRLTGREEQVLRLRLALFNNHEIARMLRISPVTVRGYLKDGKARIPTARTVDDYLILAERCGVPPMRTI